MKIKAFYTSHTVAMSLSTILYIYITHCRTLIKNNSNDNSQFVSIITHSYVVFLNSHIKSTSKESTEANCQVVGYEHASSSHKEQM